MQLGISTASFYPMLLEEAIDDLAKNDIKTIEIFVNTFSEMSEPYLSELCKRINDNGQRVVAVHPFTSGFEPFMLFGDYQRRVDDAMELHKRYFEVMNKLDSGIFVLHGDRKDGKLHKEEYFQRFARLRDIGKQFAITVAQENVERCRSRSLPFLKEMVTYLDNDVALVFDNKQATRSGITYEQFIDSLGSNIAHVHLSDSNAKCDCIAIGDGSVDISDLIGKLKLLEYSGCVVVELYRELLRSVSDIYKSYENLFVHI